MWSGPDGYLRPDQFLDHLTVIKISDFKKTYLIHQLYHGVKTIKGTHWLWTSNLLQNEIEKLPLMVSQLPPVVPTWSNLVQFDFQQKHSDPVKDSPLHRESSTKCAHRRWLCIAQVVVIHQSYNPAQHRKTAENMGKQLRTSENIYGISKNIWYHPENNWGPLIDNLVQFEEDFNSGTKKSVRWGGVGWGPVISDQTNS